MTFSIRRLGCIATLAALAPLHAQAGDGDGRSAFAGRLVDQALQSNGAYELLSELTALAPHRLSGSKGLERAIDWAAATMREIGCDDVQLQPVKVPHWVRGDVERLTVLPASGEPFELPILALGGSIATPDGGVTAGVVVVQTFEELAALGEAAKGKIVLFDRPMPRTLLDTFRAYGQTVPQRTDGAAEAAKVGAVAALVRSMTTRVDDVPHTGAMHYQDGVPKIPTAAVSTAGAERLAAMVAKGEPVQVRLELSCHTEPDADSHNVIGEIRGSERPDEVVVIGAHIDCWDVGQGAQDDGAGVAHVLEAMRLIRDSGHQPRRTVRAVLFVNEENGLRGGRAYAAEHGDETHVAAIETDAGGFLPEGFTTSEDGERRSAVAAILGELDAYGMGALRPGGGGADISPLAEKGTPLYGLAVSSHRYFDVHHSQRDRLELVNERELALGAAAMAYLATELADADLPPAAAAAASKH